MEASSDRRITIALVLSFLLHLILFSLIDVWPQERASAEKELEVFLRRRQIADIRPPEREERPKDARFLGLYDSKVDRQKVAPTPYLPPSRRRIVTDSKGRELSRSQEEGLRYAARHPSKGLPREEGEDLSSVLPQEYFPNIKVGAQTYLNVLRYPKVAYFVELKQKFKLTWNPHPVLQQFLFFGQTTAGVTATVAFKIDSSGDLAGAWIYQSSGIPAYDEEALRAVTASAPFSAPPADLLRMDGQDDGTLHIFFTFIVEIV